MRLADVLRELFPILAALYVLEGIGWSSAGQLVLWRLAAVTRALRPGFRLLPRLPGDQILVLDELRPFATTEGLWWPTSRQDTAARPHDRDRWELVPWTQAGEVTDEQSALVLAHRRIRLASPAAARRLARLCGELARLPSDERSRELRRRRAVSLDPAAVASRRAVIDRESYDPQLLGRVLLALGGGALPLLLWPEPAISSTLFAALGLLALLWLLCLVLAAATRQRLRDAGAPLPAGALLALALSPPAAALAGAALCREAFDDLDPGLVAATLLPPTAARRVLRRREAIARAAATQGETGWREHWEAVGAAIATGLLALPVSDGEDEDRTCPVCQSVFQTPRAECPDCLVPLLGASQTAAPSPAA